MRLRDKTTFDMAPVYHKRNRSVPRQHIGRLGFHAELETIVRLAQSFFPRRAKPLAGE